MSHHRDYIPSSDTDFQDWATNFYNYALACFAEWKIGESPQVTIEARLTAFNAALAKFLTPNHGKDDTIQKNLTKASLEQACRAYYSAWINNNPHVTDVDRNELRVPIHSGVRTPSTPPETFPVVDRIIIEQRQITLHFHDKTTTHRAKPKGAHECEIRWELLATPPADVSDLLRSEIDTRSPFTFTFTEKERGQILYFCLRWIGPTGLKGPWSDINHAIVP
jgi:hypothetical protein